uniref:Cystathionine gamma-synthase n=1 Tax=Physcomitrium patens TaxID=3218 RepID=A0A7I4CJV0_PHYPA
MAAALCIGQAAASAMPSAGYEYRPDASGGAASGKSGFGGSEQVPVNVARKGFFCPPCITRFPPNFVRQSSIKARRNCSNIGVAQVVAASATDRSNPAAVAAALTSSTQAELANIGNGSAVVSADANEALLESGTSLASAGASETEKPRRSKSSTLAVHGGERTRRPKVQDTLTIPICQTSTYTFKDTAELIAFQEGTFTSFEYGRYGNPTTNAVEEKISALEGAETTLLSASGMCAATTMLLALVPAGGHIVTTTDCYRRTRQFIQTVLPKMGITTTVIDPADISALQHALEQNKVSIFFSESPTNPYLRCIDIELVSKLCHEHGALVCIDGTFATPVNQQALALGADLVLHSATKYLAGHNDVLAGSLSGSKQCLSAVRALHNILGGVVDPVARVHYPGLESHPEHQIAKRQMTGFGGVISFEIDGDLETTSKFIDGLRIPYIAPSLGGVESLVEQPTIISYWDQSPAERARIGIKDNLVRFSCGVEDYEDILNDVMQSLDAL